jgi:hypothetical protein
MIGLLVRYRSSRVWSRVCQLGIVVALDPYVSMRKPRSATVKWLGDGATMKHLVRELEVVQS